MKSTPTRIPNNVIEAADKIAVYGKAHPAHPILGVLTSRAKVLEYGLWALVRKLRRTNPGLMEELPC